MKPILFNTKMVRALLEGNKTVTRRVVKPQPLSKLAYVCMGHKHGTWGYPDKDAWKYWDDESFRLPDGLPELERKKRWTPPCHTGDILYVRETWGTDINGDFVYRTNYGTTEDDSFPPSAFKWRPSIHMPREAARIFLRVTDVRVERLQDITITGLQDEGIIPDGYVSQFAACTTDAFDEFKKLWDSTIKPAGRALYGWDANPWAWVISFERCEKPKEEEPYD